MLWTNEDKRCNSLGSALDNNCCFSHSLSWKWKGGDSSWQVIKGKTKCWSTPKRWSSTSPPSAPLARGRRIVGEPQKFYLKVFLGHPVDFKITFSLTFFGVFPYFLQFLSVLMCLMFSDIIWPTPFFFIIIYPIITRSMFSDTFDPSSSFLIFMSRLQN